MLKRFRKFISDKGLVKEVLNMIMGILIVVALLVFSLTKNLISICAVILLGALINIFNGLFMIRSKEKKTMGMSMIMLGIAIILIFVIYASQGYIF
ncbi:MAG: hypothetical protein K6F63_06405 [Lachnospiraceae bacterium]|nr:hypothetical protein [Lachnospiraceae bacterium]